MIQHNVAHWQTQQQQPQQQQHQENVLNANVPQQQQISGLSVVSDQNANNQQNANVYSQGAVVPVVAPPPPAQFFNHAAYQQKPIKTADQPFTTYQQPLPQQPQHQTNYYQHQQTISSEQQQGLAQNFFDHTQNNNNINNNNSKGDGWGDWGEWNDNINSVDRQQDQQQQQQQYFNSPSQSQQLQQQPQQQPVHKPDNTANFLNESFNSSDNNWNWNMLGANEENNYILSQNPMPLTTTTTTSAITTAVAVNASNILIPPPLAMQTQASQQQSQTIELAVESTQKIKPTTLVVPAPTMDIDNDNINNVSSAAIGLAGNTSNNIPSSVYVSQAKPVTMPSRQFASPPVEVQTVAEQVFAPPPPEGFQNDPPKMISPTRVQALPPSTPSISSAPNANPFKRTGATQHHVANFIPTAPIDTKNVIAPLVLTLSPMTNMSGENNNNSGATFFMPPPATPIQMNFEPPENSEVLHENQEVLAQNLISNENSAPSASQPQQQPQPLNAERNQYLQTSHLSENAMDDSNVEGDNLPPPGLSRLVLGQPEYRVNQQQRMVTGTEDTLQNLNVNMSLDERQADGEDNASMAINPINRNKANVPMTVNTSQSNTMTSNMQMTADRNLYMVPGQSNGNNNQLPRVITGFDINEENLTTTSSQQQQQHISGQREIDLDGENLEDQQQQQQHQLPLNPQAVNMNVLAANRNEPPLEGAVAQGEQPQIIKTTTTAAITSIANKVNLLAEVKESSIHQSNNNNNSESTVNVESDREQQFKKQHGAGNVRKHIVTSDDSNNNNKNNNNKRKEKEHEKKHTSVERFDSDESADEEYSSGRERNRYKRNHREDSVRSEREHGREREESDMKYKKERRRHDKDREIVEKEKQTRDKYYRGGMDSGNEVRSDRRSKRYHRYEQDSSHEDGSRRDHTRRSTRDNRERERDRRAGDHEYDEYNRRYRNSKRGGVERSEEPHVASRHRRDRDRERERDDNSDTIERRRRRAGGVDKHQSSSSNVTRPVDMEREEYEEYRKQSSRNARESDVEKERAGGSRYDPRYTAMYGYNHHGQTSSAYGAAYDPYAYYYEHMARFNPQAYTEMYKKYYGAHGATSAGDVSAASGVLSAAGATGTGSEHLTADGRESVHSGRSSVQHDHERSGNVSLRDADVMPDPQRLTPCKFVNEHAVATLSAGLLVTVKPKYTPDGHRCNVVKVQRIGANDAQRQLMQSFPGPLVRGQTHKKTIIEFCEEQIRQGPQHTTIYATQLISTDIERFKPSYSLMWNLLILLVRQNGVVVGTDIAELLLKNQREFPYVSLKPVAPESEAVNEEQQREEVESSAEHDVKVEKNNVQVDVTLSENEITDKFRQYLLYGNVNEALDWATDNNLWGHALFLASKMDRRTHANVMMKFANKLSLNDPLQTLYQLMSGRTPSSVTSLQDEKWGDWRPHLSMILSNTSQKPELDRKAITTLGDSLFHQGDLYAAHFCYLMAQVGFGRYEHGATQETSLLQHFPKLVLLGSSNYKHFRDFANNEAIIMTEIYEYACSLNDEKFSIVEFQPYKYLYATRLLDYGHHLKSFMYMEQIALHIERDSTKYDASFVKKVFELADRLKYYDPLLEKTVNDELQDNAEDALNGSIQSFEEQKWLQNLRNLVIEPQLENVTNSSVTANDGNQIDQQFMEINRQFNELNMQYVAAETQQEQQQQPSVNVVHFETQSQQQQILYSTENYDAQQHQQQQLPPQTEQQQQQQGTQEQMLQHQQQSNVFYDPTQHQYSYAQDTQMGVNLNETGTPNAQYDFWAQQQQQQQPYLNEENARPTISLPKTKSYDSDDDKRNQQRKMTTTQKPDANKQQSKQNNKNDGKDTNTKSSQGAQNSGWFGGMWNKLTLKPKNQMILPDDKNPSIVWDAAKKRWVNTDGGDENSEENLKPPPKMNDLMPQMQNVSQPQQQQPQAHQQQPQAHQQQVPPMFQAPQIPQQQQQPVFDTTAMASPNTVPTHSAVPTKTPTLQSNKFKMQRIRTLKNSYVDVFNPSGAPMSNAADSIMAPTMPLATVPQTGFFNPGDALQPATDVQKQQQPQNVPQFYNPNQYGNNNGVGFN